jgi:hypothetical protein
LANFKKYLVIAACCNCFLLGRYSAKRSNQLIEAEKIKISLKAHNQAMVQSTSEDNKSAQAINKDSTLGQIITKKNFTFDSQGRIKSKTEVIRKTIKQNSESEVLKSEHVIIATQKVSESEVQKESLIERRKEVSVDMPNWSLGVMTPIGSYQLSTLELSVQYRLFYGVHVGVGSKLMNPDFKVGLSVDL